MATLKLFEYQENFLMWRILLLYFPLLTANQAQTTVQPASIVFVQQLRAQSSKNIIILLLHIYKQTFHWSFAQQLQNKAANLILCEVDTGIHNLYIFSSYENIYRQLCNFLRMFYHCKNHVEEEGTCPALNNSGKEINSIIFNSQVCHLLLVYMLHYTEKMYLQSKKKEKNKQARKKRTRCSVRC